MMNMRTIRVTGKGQMKVRPDATRITITLKGLSPDYGGAVKSSAEDTDRLKELVCRLGFEERDLKTLQFGVEPEYERFQDKKKGWQSRLTGYQYTHTLKLEFDSDRERLGKTLYALAHSHLCPVFRISSTVKDPEAAKSELLGRAVADSARKARVLTEAAGVRLKGIQSMDYSWGELRFESQPINAPILVETCAEAGSAEGRYDLNIEPDDIEASDTVTIVWEIE